MFCTHKFIENKTLYSMPHILKILMVKNLGVSHIKWFRACLVDYNRHCNVIDIRMA